MIKYWVSFIESLHIKDYFNMLENKYNMVKIKESN